MDKTGKAVIEPKFQGSSLGFKEGLAYVRTELRTDKGMCIDKTGSVVFKYDSPRILMFSEGLAHIVVNDKYGYIDKKGRLAIKPQFEELSIFREGRAHVKVNKKHGFIDKAGNMVVKPIYTAASGFSEGLAAVAKA